MPWRWQVFISAVGCVPEVASNGTHFYIGGLRRSRLGFLAEPRGLQHRSSELHGWLGTGTPDRRGLTGRETDKEGERGTLFHEPRDLGLLLCRRR